MPMSFLHILKNNVTDLDAVKSVFPVMKHCSCNETF